MKKVLFQLALLSLSMGILSCVREPLDVPGPGEDAYIQGSAALANGQYGEAQAYFEQVIQDTPSSSKVDNALLGLSDVYRALGRRDSAVYVLRQMPTGSSYYQQSLLQQGQLMVEDMAYWPVDSAIHSLRGSIKKVDKEQLAPELWYSLGAAFYKKVSSGNLIQNTYYDSALAQYASLRSLYPSHSRFADAEYRIGWILYQKGLWGSAADTLENYAQNYASSASADGAWYWAAKSRSNAHQDCLALKDARKLLSLYPQSDKRSSLVPDTLGWSCP